MKCAFAFSYSPLLHSVIYGNGTQRHPDWSTFRLPGGSPRSSARRGGQIPSRSPFRTRCTSCRSPPALLV
jgi:hypothetical protein